MIYHCKVCRQPIPREAAIKTVAGGFMNGYCQRHAEETPDVSSSALNTVISNPALVEHLNREEEADANEDKKDAGNGAEA